MVSPTTSVTIFVTGTEEVGATLSHQHHDPDPVVVRRAVSLPAISPSTWVKWEQPFKIETSLYADSINIHMIWIHLQNHDWLDRHYHGGNVKSSDHKILHFYVFRFGKFASKWLSVLRRKSNSGEWELKSSNPNTLETMSQRLHSQKNSVLEDSFLRELAHHQKNKKDIAQFKFYCTSQKI